MGKERNKSKKNNNRLIKDRIARHIGTLFGQQK